MFSFLFPSRVSSVFVVRWIFFVWVDFGVLDVWWSFTIIIIIMNKNLDWSWNIHDCKILTFLKFFSVFILLFVTWKLICGIEFTSFFHGSRENLRNFYFSFCVFHERKNSKSCWNLIDYNKKKLHQRAWKDFFWINFCFCMHSSSKWSTAGVNWNDKNGFMNQTTYNFPSNINT